MIQWTIIGGSILATVAMAPYIFGMTLKEFFNSRESKVLIGVIVIGTGLLLNKTDMAWIKYPWLCWLMGLSMMDLKTHEVRLIDLIILLVLSTVGIPIGSIGVVAIMVGLFVITLLGLKYALHKWYQQNAFGGADIMAIVSVLLCLGGTSAIIALYISVFCSAIVGVVMLVFFNANRKTPIPFLPFLMVGSVVSLMYSTHIYDWYMALIG